MTRRRALVNGAALLLLAAAVAIGVARGVDSGPACGTAVTSLSAAESSSPFLDEAGMEEQPDEDRDRAVASLAAGPSPFGPVVGAVGYNYEQWAQLSSYAQGIGVRTRDNPDFTMLDDEDLKPLWSVQVDTKRSTYDADENTYLVATLPKKGAPDLVALDANTGKRRWCTSLGGPNIREGDPLATVLLGDGTSAVLGPGEGGKERVVRFDRDGNQQWEREVNADAGDFLGLMPDGSAAQLLAGGRAQFELADDQALATRPVGAALVALDLRSGRTTWRRQLPAGAAGHVIGVEDGFVALAQRDKAGAPERLIGLSEQGDELWSVDPGIGQPLDAALRAGRVLVRNGSRLAAHDLRTGKQLWRRTLPTKPQFLPYGFELADVPLLDDEHAVLGTTTGLRVLDLRTGKFTATAPLPVDGINTTFWPYQVVVSERHLAVATNTSAIVLLRQ